MRVTGASTLKTRMRDLWPYSWLLLTKWRWLHVHTECPSTVLSMLLGAGLASSWVSPFLPLFQQSMNSYFWKSKLANRKQPVWAFLRRVGAYLLLIFKNICYSGTEKIQMRHPWPYSWRLLAKWRLLHVPTEFPSMVLSTLLGAILHFDCPINNLQIVSFNSDPPWELIVDKCSQKY